MSQPFFNNLSSSASLASSSIGDHLHLQQQQHSSNPARYQQHLEERSKMREELFSEEQKLCAVCNDVAVCQHYGALTCEGCKGFFKVIFKIIFSFKCFLKFF